MKKTILQLPLLLKRSQIIPLVPGFKILGVKTEGSQIFISLMVDSIPSKEEKELPFEISMAAAGEEFNYAENMEYAGAVNRDGIPWHIFAETEKKFPKLS